MKQQFKAWLEKSGKSGAALSYPSAIDQISEHYSKATGSYVDIYSIGSLNSISEIATDYRQTGRFSEFGYEMHGRYRAAIGRYAEYFAQREGKAPEQRQDAGNSFAYERDLQTSLCAQISELFPEYQIFGEGLQGVQYSIGGKRIDLLLEHRENNSLLAVELKSGQADFTVFGEMSMYLGLLQEAYPDRRISGVIVAGAIDPNLKLACSITDKIILKTYRMYLELEEV